MKNDYEDAQTLNVLPEAQKGSPWHNQQANAQSAVELARGEKTHTNAAFYGTDQ